MLEGHVAFGFLDKKFKYGAGMTYMLSKDPRRSIGLNFLYDLEQLGQSQNAFSEDNFFAAFFRRSPADKLNMVREFSGFYEHEWFQGFSSTVRFLHRELFAIGDDGFIINEGDDQLLMRSITSSEIQLQSRLAFRERYPGRCEGTGLPRRRAGFLAGSTHPRLQPGRPPAAVGIIAVANQPETLGLVQGVWGGENHQQEQLRQIKKMLDMLPMMPPALREKLEAQLLPMPPEFRALLDALPPEGPAKPDLAPLLAQLVSVGLVTEQREEPDDANPNLTCHELIRERIRAWMEQQPQDRADLTENAIRLAYSERLEGTFKALLHRNMTAALQAGSRALVYCVQAGAWDRLGGFASGVVTSTSDPRLLEPLVEHLMTAAESAPEGKPRRSVRYP